MDSKLTGFGTILVMCSPVVLAFVFWPQNKKSLLELSLFIFLVLTGTFLSISIFRTNIRDKRFNLIQNSVLRFLRPYQIIEALPPKIKTSLKNEKKALKLLTKFEMNREYEVELFLLERLNNKYSDKQSKQGYFLGVLIFIALTIVAALIEFITQDKIYEPFLKELIK